MFANSRVIALIGICIVALLILAGCQPGNSTPEITEEIVIAPAEFVETVVEVENLGIAQSTVEEMPAEQVVDQPTEIAIASPTEEVVELPTEVDSASPPDNAGPATTYLGDVVEFGGFYISATNVYDPAELENYDQPEEGEKLVAIDVILGVTTRGRKSVGSEISLVDKEGFTYISEIPWIVDFIYPGEKLRFLVVFKIPENAIPTILEYEHKAVGLGAPPEGHQSNSEILNVPPMEPESKLGDTVSKEGYSISAQGVKDPAEPLTSYNPKSGEKLVAVDVLIENENEFRFKYYSPHLFYLVDNLGYLYPSEVGSVDGEIQNIYLMPGKKVRGWVAFRIPEDASAYILKYGPGIYIQTCYLDTGLVE